MLFTFARDALYLKNSEFETKHLFYVISLVKVDFSGLIAIYVLILLGHRALSTLFYVRSTFSHIFKKHHMNYTHTWQM
jgi:hypothetical protein